MMHGEAFMNYFDKLFIKGNSIIETESQLNNLINRNTDTKSVEYLELVERLKKLLLEENDIVSKMTIEDVEETFGIIKTMLKANSTIEFYDKLETYEDIELYLNSEDAKKSDYIRPRLEAILRIFNRIKNQAFMLTNGKIKLKVGKDEKATCYVSKWDALKSTIDIAILKSINWKIDRLNPENEYQEYYTRDKKIIRDLRKNFSRYLLNIVFSSFELEFRMAFSNFNINTLKLIDINRVISLGEFDKAELDAFLLNELEEYLDEFATVTCYDSIYNANNLFQVLRLVTSIEVLLPYVKTDDIINDMYLDILCDKSGNISGEAVNEFVRRRVRWVENTHID